MKVDFDWLIPTVINPIISHDSLNARGRAYVAYYTLNAAANITSQRPMLLNTMQVQFYFNKKNTYILQVGTTKRPLRPPKEVVTKTRRK